MSLTGAKLTIGTLCAYLAGNRQAIRTIARTRGAVGVGALLVIAAGFARNYDSRDLLHEGWYVLIPLVASTTVASILFVLLRLAARASSLFPGFWSGYRDFLALVYMTAPLALAYAVPYERMLSPEGAVSARIWSILLVSVWRVVLIVRVIGVVFDTTGLSALWIVMFVSDAAVLGALSVAKVPLIQFMGGIHLTARENILAEATLLVRLGGLISAPLWAAGALTVLIAGQLGSGFDSNANPRVETSRGLKRLALAAVLVWAAVLPFTQPAQQLRTETERALKANRLKEALAIMSAHRQSEYPPHWDPPPRPGFSENTPPLLDVVEAVSIEGATEWVRRVYLGKLEAAYVLNWLIPRYRPEEWTRVGQLLEHFPEAELMRQEYATRTQTEVKRTAAARATTTGPTGAPD